MLNRKRKYLLAIAIPAVILDQLTKWWAMSLEFRPPVEIIENFFHFIYVENKGAAWSMFADLPDNIRIPFFAVISFISVGFVLYFFTKIENHHTGLIVGLSSILGGALGNVIDRFTRDGVIDFIDWHYYNHHWPTFNVADIYITVGVGLLLIEMFFGKSDLSLFHRPEESEQKTDSSSPSNN